MHQSTVRRHLLLLLLSFLLQETPAFQSLVRPRIFTGRGGRHIAAAETETETEKAAVVTIRFCQGCNWMLRASWMSQELLSTFNNGEISEIRLQPQYTAPGGDFEVRVNDRAVWDRRVDGGFPQPKELKRRVRDAISPDRDLGHNDRGEGGS